MPGELAKQNAMRNPRRTSSTAAALMIGLTLVVSMGVFASSLKASFGDVISDQTNADLYVVELERSGPRLQPVGDRGGQGRRGRGQGLGQRLGPGAVRQRGPSFSAVDPATAEEVMNLDVSAGFDRRPRQGRGRGLEGDGDGQGLEARGHGAGRVRRPPGSTSCTIVGIYDGKGWISDNFVLSLDEQNAFAGPQLVSSGLVTVAAGADQADVQKAIAAALADHPDAKVLDQKEFEKEASGFIDQLLTFVTVMLLLAVLIALLGIVNTLALSVFERTRELGLLRAVGMTRGQVRAMVRWESVVISLIGALSGAALGIGIGLALSQALKDEGIKAISIPGPQIALYVVLAAVAGVLAAVGPARSAAKVDVLKAVVTD